MFVKRDNYIKHSDRRQFIQFVVYAIKFLLFLFRVFGGVRYNECVLTIVAFDKKKRRHIISANQTKTKRSEFVVWVWVCVCECAFKREMRSNHNVLLWFDVVVLCTNVTTFLTRECMMWFWCLTERDREKARGLYSSLATRRIVGVWNGVYNVIQILF